MMFACSPFSTRCCKQRKDSITQFAAAGQDDLVAQEQLELSVIENSCPNNFPEAEVADIISASLKRTGHLQHEGHGQNHGRPEGKTAGAC